VRYDQYGVRMYVSTGREFKVSKFLLRSDSAALSGQRHNKFNNYTCLRG